MAVPTGATLDFRGDPLLALMIFAASLTAIFTVIVARVQRLNVHPPGECRKL
ncbi:MAG: hypothetical protein WD009_00170 [Phycisphaeraceae bacterium]